MSRAFVCADGVNTSYVRAGRGKPLVLVTENLEATDTQEMIAALSRDHLVLAAAPQLTDVGELRTWLRGFIDGLGVAEAHLILQASVTAVLLGGG